MNVPSVRPKHLPCFVTGIFLSTALVCCTSCSSGTVSISANAYDFGSTAVNTRIHRVVVTVSNATSVDVATAPNISGTIQSAMTRSGSCEATIPAGSACSMVLTFAPTASGSQTGALNLNLTGTHLPASQTVSLAGTGVQLSAGGSLISETGNPLVALYSYYPTSPGKVWIDFGTTTSYGLKTSMRATPTDGGTVSIYVAGMRANTMYHMRASAQLDDGTVLTDTDHTFTTSNFPENTLPTLAVTTNGTPQPGIEMVDVTSGTTSTYLQAYATDLQGNLIWGYNYPDRLTDSIVQPVKLLANGNMLVTVSYASGTLADGIPSGEVVDIREIDLAGNPIRDISADELNSRLATAGYSLTIYDIHHDVAILPNGHWVLIASTLKNVSGTNIEGDVVIDLDTNLQPVWVWNEFDHLDTSRRPVGFPDWTHTNAVLYSADDGNLLVSMRHQSWIVKVNYNNGAGDGSILWHLGEGGDFTLTNGTDPIDWFYGQHQPSFVSSNTSGVFTLAMMDNGYNREVSSGTNCGTTAIPCYTTVPILSIDETKKTATILNRYTLPTSQYSFWGGGTTPLANGDLEFDLASQDTSNSEVNEIHFTDSTSASVIWQMTATGINMYRANRLPSLYPGVQW